MKLMTHRFVWDAFLVLFPWRPVVKQLLGPGLAVFAYFFAGLLMFDLAFRSDMTVPGWMEWTVSFLLWPTVAVAAISFAIASLRSALPALIGIVATPLLYLSGYTEAAAASLLLMNIATAIFTFGFLFWPWGARISS